VAQLYFIRNRLDDALAERERVYQSGDRGFYIANVTVPIALAAGRRFEIEKWLRRAHDDRSYLYLGQTTIWEVLRENLDDRDAMLESWRKLQSMPELDTFTTVWAAWLGDDEMALTSMQRSPDPWFMWTPLLKRVRRTDEFKQIVIDAGLVDYWREFGWGDFCSPTEGDDFECH
jgi:HAMP domain-containing protein